MAQVTSNDGTRIDFDKIGQGPAVILVASALADRGDTKRLARLLQSDFTVINYDRRGRGRSGDTAPYAVEREIEDLAALIDVVGGSANVFGSSSGAVLVARAAASGAPIDRMALYEPPFRLSTDVGAEPVGLQERLDDLLSSGKSSQAVALFMREDMEIPAPLVMLIPGTWWKMKAMAHTIRYDQAVMGDTLNGEPLVAEHWQTARVPALVMYGSKTSPRLWGCRGSASGTAGFSALRAGRPEPLIRCH